MSDQAAAETLVTVARLGVGNGGTQGEESDGDAEQPKKKRARRGKADKGKSGSRKERDDEDTGIDDDVDAGEKSGRVPQKRSRDSNGTSWGDPMGDGRPTTGRGIHVTEAGHAGSSSAPSPAHDHHQRAQSVPRGVQGPEVTGLEGRYVHLQRGFNSPHPHGGFDLPPLNAALSGGEISGVAVGSGRGYGGYGFAGTPSSYMRSGSSAPSRTHSPLNSSGMGTGAYLLPLPHMQGLQHSHPYYPGVGSSQPSAMSALHAPSPPPANEAGMAMLGGVPSVSELERHYFELHEQRKKLEEMLEKTDRLMVGVKRGIDEMRSGGGQQEAQAPPAPGASSASAIPIRTAGLERERSRESVWPSVESPSRE
jgi:GATA-binding protein, other eukaryote